MTYLWDPKAPSVIAELLLLISEVYGYSDGVGIRTLSRRTFLLLPQLLERRL